MFGIGFVVITTMTHATYAFETSPFPTNQNGQNLILIPNHLNRPLDISPFIATTKTPNNQQPLLVGPSASRSSQSSYFSSQSNNAEDMGDQVLALVPHGDDMKYLWNVVDGDVDLYFSNLRADRKNKGMVYTTETLPLVGTFDHTEFKVKGGAEENAFSFETSHIPLAGDLEGFKFNGTLSDNNSRVSLHYTVPLDF